MLDKWQATFAFIIISFQNAPDSW